MWFFLAKSALNWKLAMEKTVLIIYSIALYSYPFIHTSLPFTKHRQTSTAVFVTFVYETVVCGYSVVTSGGERSTGTARCQPLCIETSGVLVLLKREEDALPITYTTPMEE